MLYEAIKSGYDETGYWLAGWYVLTDTTFSKDKALYFRELPEPPTVKNKSDLALACRWLTGMLVTPEIAVCDYRINSYMACQQPAGKSRHNFMIDYLVNAIKAFTDDIYILLQFQSLYLKSMRLVQHQILKFL